MMSTGWHMYYFKKLFFLDWDATGCICQLPPLLAPFFLPYLAALSSSPPASLHLHKEMINYTLQGELGSPLLSAKRTCRSILCLTSSCCCGAAEATGAAGASSTCAVCPRRS